MTLRCATPGTHRALLELAVAFYAEDRFATPRAQPAAHLRVLLAADTARVAVIDLDGTDAAFGITTTVFGLENGVVAELEDLYVAAHARRRGLTRQLIDDSGLGPRPRRTSLQHHHRPERPRRVTPAALLHRPGLP
jgi:aminoglycoside 6'-N-acetyltransferase I